MTEPTAQPPTAQSIEEITRSASAELDSLEDLEAVDQWRVWRAATTASNRYDARQYIRHGSVWLYERVAVADDTP